MAILAVPHSLDFHLSDFRFDSSVVSGLDGTASIEFGVEESQEEEEEESKGDSSADKGWKGTDEHSFEPPGHNSISESEVQVVSLRFEAEEEEEEGEDLMMGGEDEAAVSLRKGRKRRSNRTAEQQQQQQVQNVQ